MLYVTTGLKKQDKIIFSVLSAQYNSSFVTTVQTVIVIQD